MFISFEGVEGAGKSTQIARLAGLIKSWGRDDVLVTREPGDSPLGAKLRELVLSPPSGVSIDAHAELLIMLADRAQHVSEVIRPHLDRGGIVLCDRYADSSVAYQGYGRGLDVATVHQLNAFATGGLVPDRTFVLDLDPAVGLQRQSEKTRMEAEALAFHQRVRAGFLALAEAEPDRIAIVDASGSADAVTDALACDLRARIPS
jgi:dTMP kinase